MCIFFNWKIEVWFLCRKWESDIKVIWYKTAFIRKGKVEVDYINIRGVWKLISFSVVFSPTPTPPPRPVPPGLQEGAVLAWTGNTKLNSANPHSSFLNISICRNHNIQCLAKRLKYVFRLRTFSPAVELQAVLEFESEEEIMWNVQQKVAGFRRHEHISQSQVLQRGNSDVF